MTLSQLLSSAVAARASDLYLSALSPPMLRVDGALQVLSGSVPYSDEDIKALLASVMSPDIKAQFQQVLEVDFAAHIASVGWCRVNVFHQARGVAATFRLIPTQIPALQTLGLPPIIEKLCQLRHGLVLITGATGSGKSTTIASMLDKINHERAIHVITIEDPIEFHFENHQSLINQREIGRDTHSFSNALRAALREAPDIIFIGEMRDLETIRLALTAAETGQLVFATLHTASASSTINRIIDVFPGDEKSLVRSMLSQSLKAVLCQTLLRKKGGGRVVASEVMMVTPAICNLIRENKVEQILSVIQTGAAQGMQTLEQDLKRLKEVILPF